MEGTKELTNSQITEKFKLQKDSGTTFRERRHDTWNEIYLRYRNKPQVNRLINRQSVILPLMKYAIQSYIKDMEKLPSLYFHNLSNDDQKELFYNEHWKYTLKHNKLPTKDKIEKKSAGLFGRAFRKMNIVNGKVSIKVVPTINMLIDRYCDPSDINTSQYVIETKIYKSLYELEQMDNLDKKALARIKFYFQSKEGVVEAEKNYQEMLAMNDRMSKLGLEDAYNPKVDETYVEINQAYMKLYSNLSQKEVFHICNFACTEGGTELLTRNELSEIFGKVKGDFWDDNVPYSSWTPDDETDDFWSDGPGDVVLPTARIIDAWGSQLVENRTLRNYGMNYYDATKKKFMPQAWTPQPGGWYGLPGKPSDVFQKVDIPELSESIDEIQFFIELAEKAVAINATQQGAVEKSDVTLGEIKLSLQNAKERIKDSSTSYIDSWEDTATKYVKMLEGAFDSLDPVEVSQKGRNNLKNYSKIITAEDWFDNVGYRVEIKTEEDKQQKDIEDIQKLQAVKTIMPENEVLEDILEKKACEFAGLTMDQTQQVLDKQKEIRMAMQYATQNTMGANPQPQEAIPVSNLTANQQTQPVTTIA